MAYHFFPHAKVTITAGTIAIDATSSRVDSTITGSCDRCSKTFEGPFESFIFHIAKHADEAKDEPKFSTGGSAVLSPEAANVQHGPFNHTSRCNTRGCHD